MDRRILLPLLAAVGVVFACGPLPHFGSGVSPRRSTAPTFGHTTGGARTPARRVRHRAGEPEVDGTLAVAPAGGSEVHFALAVVNASDKRLEVKFPDGHTRDFAVYDAAGHELWRASRGRLYTQLVQNALLAAGDSVVYEADWRAPAPGRYAVVAELRSSNHPVLRRGEFVVTPNTGVAVVPGDTAPRGATPDSATPIAIAAAR